MSLKRLPVNISDFKELQENNCIYVDKTEQIHTILKMGKAFFLSRPRRFGKSLLISTLNELFENRKELLKNNGSITVTGNGKNTLLYDLIFLILNLIQQLLLNMISEKRLKMLLENTALL